MTREEHEKMGFREWTEHYEKEQESDRTMVRDLAAVVGSLTQNVGTLTAKVETVVDQQKGMYNRLNRPWQWGVVVAGFTGIISLVAIMATMMTLVINPIKDSLMTAHQQNMLLEERNLELHMWFRQTQEKAQMDIVENSTDIKWIKELESRLNNRIHSIGVN